MGALGAALILAVLWDAFETMILPRRMTRRIRLTALFYACTWRPWRYGAGRIGKRRWRESVLGYYGPLSTIFLLAMWAAGMVLGFALVQYAAGTHLRGPQGLGGFVEDLYMSGVTFCTLGLGDVTPDTNTARALTVAEGFLGFGFLAIIVGYFPVLYQAFSRREVNISLMDARAGSPSSAVELLRRYRGNLDRLEGTLHEVEHWVGELMESHISYPALSYFRSQHDNQSWLGMLTTVLDVCALGIVGLRDLPPWQPQMTFALARHAVVDLSQVLQVSPCPPDPDRLPPEEFRRLHFELSCCDSALPEADRSYGKLLELRELYEPYVNGLALHLSMRLPGWLPPERVVHNWETSAWGGKAVRALEDDHA